MSYHKDNNVNYAMIRLMDALCEWERDTGRRSTLLLIPHNENDRLVMAQDGKPLPHNIIGVTPDILLKEAMISRKGRG